MFTTLTNDNITLGDPGTLQIMPFFIELYTVAMENGFYHISLVSNTNVTDIDDNEVGINLQPFKSSSCTITIRLIYAINKR